jgi:hypothetical protein
MRLDFAGSSSFQHLALFIDIDLADDAERDIQAIPAHPPYGQDDLESRVPAARFIHNSNPKFIAEKTMGPYALPGSLRRNPIIASNSWTRIIATASAATPTRDRKAIAYAAANGSATLREAAYRAYSCPSTMRSDSKEKPALTTALKSVNPAQAQYALPTPCGALMS